MTEQTSTALAVQDDGKMRAFAGPAGGVYMSSIQLSTMSDVREFAETLALSSFVPKAFQGKAKVNDIVGGILWAGVLRISPIVMLQGLANINGRMCIWGDLALSICKMHKDWVDIHEFLDRDKNGQPVAVCMVRRRGYGRAIERRFSWGDATQAGLTNKGGPWKQYPKRMLQLRARGFALRDAFPESFFGLGFAEEQRDVEGKSNPKAYDVVSPGENGAPDIVIPSGDAKAAPGFEKDVELYYKDKLGDDGEPYDFGPPSKSDALAEELEGEADKPEETKD